MHSNTSDTQSKNLQGSVASIIFFILLLLCA